MIIDSRVIRASMGNDLKFIREAAADFLSGARTDIANITQAISATDTEEVRAGSHRLKGAAAIFGANDLKHVCAEPSTAVSRGRQDHSEARAPRPTPFRSVSCAELRVAIALLHDRFQMEAPLAVAVAVDIGDRVAITH